MEGGRWEWKFKGEAGEEGLREDGWTERGMISVRRDCHGKCTTALHGGI